MAYLTCPDCMMPNPVGDDAVKYACFDCFAEIIFETCPGCGYQQAVPSRWQGAFACGHCSQRVEIPRQGYGYMYPRM